MPGRDLKEGCRQADTVLEVDKVGLPLCQQLLEDRLYVQIEVEITNLRCVVEIVYDAANRQAVKAILDDVIVSAVGEALTTEDPYIVTSDEAAAELMRVLLNSGCRGGRKAICNLKDSHGTGIACLSSRRASYIICQQPVHGDSGFSSRTRPGAAGLVAVKP